jgi:hypothetical protein
MEYGICNLSVIPVRNEPSDKSEMTSQLLFCDFVKIIERYKNWLKVEALFDNYEGWVDSKQLAIITKDYSDKNISSSNIVIENVTEIINESLKFNILAVIGSAIPASVNGSFFINNDKYSFLQNDIYKDDLSIEQIALKYCNTPYLWGGRTPFGIDCSGFTQIVYKIYGVCLKRDASQQAEQGIQVDFLSEVKSGDLAFFENEDGKIIHVGILLSENKIIHASGKVKIDDIDHEGIFSRENDRYTHKLRFIKRIEPSVV